MEHKSMSEGERRVREMWLELAMNYSGGAVTEDVRIDLMREATVRVCAEIIMEEDGDDYGKRLARRLCTAFVLEETETPEPPDMRQSLHPYKDPEPECTYGFVKTDCGEPSCPKHGEGTKS